MNPEWREVAGWTAALTAAITFLLQLAFFAGRLWTQVKQCRRDLDGLGRRVSRDLDGLGQRVNRSEKEAEERYRALSFALLACFIHQAREMCW